METALEFMKLEKVELGGIKGRVLSEHVVGIFEEFQEHYTVFTQRTYDSLDPNSHVSFVMTSSTFLIEIYIS